MRFDGRMAGDKVNILIDTDATHNIIDAAKAKVYSDVGHEGTSGR